MEKEYYFYYYQTGDGGSSCEPHSDLEYLQEKINEDYNFYTNEGYSFEYKIMKGVELEIENIAVPRLKIIDK